MLYPSGTTTEYSITFPLRKPFDVSAIRLWWRDEGLNYDAGDLPGPLKFKVEGHLGEDEWLTIVDKTQNESDMPIDFLTFDTTSVDNVRLTITGWPESITPALIDCTIFGVRSQT